MSENCCPPEGADAAAGSSEARAAPARSGRPATLACPTCGQTGRPVDTITVKALLAVPLTELRAGEYRFCRTVECPTVYYAAGGEQTFAENALRERVHQKHLLDDAVFVCYCFRHTPESIKEEVRATGRSTVVQRVTAGIQEEQCACEIRNPQGSCCLGNVRAVVKRVTGAQATSPQGARDRVTAS